MNSGVVTISFDFFENRRHVMLTAKDYKAEYNGDSEADTPASMLEFAVKCYCEDMNGICDNETEEYKC